MCYSVAECQTTGQCDTFVIIPSVQCSVKVHWYRPFNIPCCICSSVLNVFLLVKHVQREIYLNLTLILNFSVFLFPSGCVCLCLSICVCVCLGVYVCERAFIILFGEGKIRILVISYLSFVTNFWELWVCLREHLLFC